MKVRVLYFASVREQVERDGETLELPAGVVTVGALRQHLMERGDAWPQALSNKRVLRVAVNQDMAGPDTALHDDDEIAFFPPVTGG